MSDESTADGRSWRRVAALVGLAVVVVLALLAGGLWLYSEHLYRTSYESAYDYTVVLNTNETIENVELFLPLPVAAGKPDLGVAMVEEGNAEADDLSYAVVETERGPMLQVTADRIEVTPRYYEFVERNGTGERVEIPTSQYDPSNPNMTRDANAGTLVSVTVPADEAVATDDPWGVEPTLNPRTDRRPAACGFPVGDWLRCYEYDSQVYASYGTNDSTRVDVVTRVEGRNGWWSFGWNYDVYSDEVTLALFGSQDGWTNATGTVEVDLDRREPPEYRRSPAEAPSTREIGGSPAATGEPPRARAAVA